MRKLNRVSSVKRHLFPIKPDDFSLAASGLQRCLPFAFAFCRCAVLKKDNVIMSDKHVGSNQTYNTHWSLLDLPSRLDW